MRRLVLLVTFTMIAFLMVSCNYSVGNRLFSVKTNDEVADDTIEKIVLALQEQDSEKFIDLFSKNTQAIICGENDTPQEFMTFIGSEILSFSKAVDKGISYQEKKDNGYRCKEIGFAFELQTKSDTFHIAIKQCLQDTYDDDNIGIESLYVISGKIWTDPYVYRGDGEWTPGINIQVESPNEKNGDSEGIQIGTIEEGRSYRITYEKIDFEEGYYCYFYDVDGNIAKIEGALKNKPEVVVIEDQYLRMTMQEGNDFSTQWGYYYDISRNVFSETYSCVFGEDDGKVAYATFESVIVCDIFDKEKYFKEISDFKNEFSAVIQPIIEVEFKGENCIEVTYLAGDDKQEVTELFEL